MKKLILSGFVIVSIGIAIVGCKKEKIETKKNIEIENDFPISPNESNVFFKDNNDYSKLTVKNEMLVFETIEYYKSFLEKENQESINHLTHHIERMNYKSFGEIYPESKLFDDDFMEVLLNKDQIVKIGEWLIKVNPLAEKVFVINSITQNAINILQREDVNDKSILVFSTDESVLDFLENPKEIDNRGFWCGDGGVASRHHSSHLGQPTIMDNKIDLRHRKWGIYFSIKVTCNSINIYNQRFWIQYSVRKYKHRCKTYYDKGSGYVWSPLIATGGHWKHVLTSSYRNLNKYHIKIENAGRVTVPVNGGAYQYNGSLNLSYLEIRVNI